MQENCVRSMGQKDPPEKGMATHSSILAWIISGTEEPGGIQSMGLQRVRHNRVTKHNSYISKHITNKDHCTAQRTILHIL